ncbi:histidinol-phosphate transaminase [Scrofimicrobium canadense]|uniref:histidinol-phosphate transaminase n=1 Tax=Scrofimicrobium canadense TaxID=2652290 RepID=UPI00298DC290|nr:histidinol-phosphate transaminase [Scrofimicrobium canadense]
MRVIHMRDAQPEKGFASILPRPEIDTAKAVEIVAPILDRVREEGAAALYHFSEHFDHVRPESLRVSRNALKQALEDVDPKILNALRTMIAHVRATHEAQLPRETETEVIPGGMVFQRWVPLRRVGLYVPGGLAVYPSSVVMNVVAAQVAGVDSIVVATPPQAEFKGLPHPTILAACELLGITEVIAAGGSQAIAAMAYGFTDGDYECVPVDKVTGPGNIYVAAAKRLVQDTCGIDAEAGTTEIGILADNTARADYVAADLISQAEHDPAAASVLITDSESLIEVVQEELERQILGAFHEDRIRTALSGPQSAIVLVDDLTQGEAVVEAYGPEHLEIITADATERAMRIRNAGAIFVGHYSPVPLGDYMAGSNHVLPTGGTARYASGLNSTQFLRSVQVIDYDAAALSEVTGDLVALSEAEQLPAHGTAALIRKGASSQRGVRLPRRRELADVEPYGAPQLDAPVRLNVNENPYAPSDEVVDAVTQAVRGAMTRLNRYADRDAVALREKLAGYLRLESGVELPIEQLWAANGSNEVMVQLLQAFGGPGRVAMACAPTYSMYEEYARDTNTGWVLLPPGEGLFPSPRVSDIIAGLRTHRPAVLLLPSPNNPTGIPVELDDVKEILEAATSTGPGGAATLVVIDEAYSEFREPGIASALTLLDRYPHLVVTRTMSKAFAAAGLRLGYMAAAPEVIDEVQKVRLPYHLSLLTQAAGIAAIDYSPQQLAQIDLIRSEREKLAQWLREQGYQVAQSSSNFLLFGPLPDRTSTWQGLVDRGVLVRIVGPESTLRVTVGTPEENQRFREALVEVES